MEINYEIIEKYLAKELTSEELSNFNNELKNNSDFKKEVELYIEVNKSLTKKYKNIDKENALKKTLHTISQKHFNLESLEDEKNNKKIPLKNYFLRISSIAAIFLIAFFLLKPQTNLYDKYAEHSALEIQVKGENDQTLLEAAKYFNDEKYAKAIPFFENYLKENKNDIEIQMSLGIALLENNHAKKSITIFKQIYNQDNVFKNKATWYLALANIKDDKNIQAKEYLKLIPEDTFYSKKAKKLLKELK